MARYRVGSKVRMTADALDNYGQEYAGKKFTISHVATEYMPSAQFFAQGKPEGCHPGYDEASGDALYDFDELEFSLYEWEVTQ